MLRQDGVGNTLRGNVRPVWQAFVVSSRPLVRQTFMTMCEARGMVVSIDEPPSRTRAAVQSLALLDLDSADEIRPMSGNSALPKRVVLAARSPSPRLQRELEHGVDAVITSDDPLHELGQAIDAVLIGQAYASKSAARLMLELFRTTQPAPLSRATELSDRERDVLRLLVRGLTAKAMANTLDISMKTVEAHRSRLYAKLRVRTQTQAVARAAMDPALLGGGPGTLRPTVT